MSFFFFILCLIVASCCSPITAWISVNLKLNPIPLWTSSPGLVLQKSLSCLTRWSISELFVTTAPPWPVVMILCGVKENVPTSQEFSVPFRPECLTGVFNKTNVVVSTIVCYLTHVSRSSINRHVRQCPVDLETLARPKSIHGVLLSISQSDPLALAHLTTFWFVIIV